MTRDRIVSAIMNKDDRAVTITMAQHSAMMSAQYVFLTNAVETTLRQLVRHLITISNMAEQAIQKHWQLLCLISVLRKTIREKNRALKERLSWRGQMKKLYLFHLACQTSHCVPLRWLTSIHFSHGHSLLVGVKAYSLTSQPQLLAILDLQTPPQTSAKILHNFNTRPGIVIAQS